MASRFCASRFTPRCGLLHFSFRALVILFSARVPRSHAPLSSCFAMALLYPHFNLRSAPASTPHSRAPLPPRYNSQANLPASLARPPSLVRSSLSSHPENPMQLYRQEGQFVSVFFPLDQALDRLVPASSHIAASSPPAYLPCRLQGVLPTCVVAVFFLRGASRLDAFSVYPVRTSLPSCALGRTTVAPVVRPFRSSRTRNSSSHDSYAHDG